MGRSIRIKFLETGIFVLAGCTYNDIPKSFFDCSSSSLSVALVSKVDPTTCNAIDGSITVSAKGGVSPYAFSVNGSAFQTNATLPNLGPGSYAVIVQDANQCQSSIQVDLTAPNSTLEGIVATTADNQCLSDNGTISVTASGGTPPYSFQFETEVPGSVSSFINLKSGSYTITLRDSLGCPKIINVLVPRGDTGTSYKTDIQPIIATNCAIPGCHNGDNGSSRNWTVFNNVQANAQNIKTRTGNRSMPLVGSLTQDQINLIACWVDDGAKNN
jgi:SprB repeat